MVKVPLSTEMQLGPTNDTGICFDVATAKNLCALHQLSNSNLQRI